MKILFCSLLLALCIQCRCFAQSEVPAGIPIQHIPAEGVLLDKGWKFQLGDDPQWAHVDFNDQEWQPIDPTLDINEALPQIPRSGIAWFRLHLSLDSTLLRQQLALIMKQSGASELYLNGQLIYRFGVLSSDPDQVKAYDPMLRPVRFPVMSGTRHVLAVRYALQPEVQYTTMFETSNPAFWIRLKNLNTAIADHERYLSSALIFWTFIVGACALLIFIHLAFYVFYPQQKANLSFALFAFFFMTQNILRIWLFLNAHEVASRFLLFQFCFTLILIADLFLLTAIYQLSNQGRDKIYYGLITLVVLSILLVIPRYGWGWIAGGALMEVIIKLKILQIALQSAKKGKRGAWIIAGGAVSCLVLFVFFLSLGVFSRDFLIGLTPFRSVLYIASVLSIPIATSIYLGLDFAFINSTLQKKLEEVEELSQKTLQQEKEKQEILSSQRDLLKKQVQERTAELKESLAELSATQTQLIQKEKMASLGELTAGIAHEIQNPLNFVNNFSEVSHELCSELKQELEAGNTAEAFPLVDDLQNNLHKIKHHGQRADSIVKGMLQHSRTTTGEKLPTDINALAEEYLRLSYREFRSKDKNFNATLVTDFDRGLGKHTVAPQELGRALLNLFNNAFYATQQKKMHLKDAYQPEVRLSTQLEEGKVEIKVWDNGDGIPEGIRSKIFQPFFTTKPTGQGTGLGLSLSYDIITKGHGGELKMETREGAYTEFRISLPVSSEKN